MIRDERRREALRTLGYSDHVIDGLHWKQADKLVRERQPADDDRTAGLPPRGHGPGDWYVAKLSVSVHCVYCGNAHKDHPGVLEYLRAQDPGMFEANIEHPGWARTGWLVWWDCPRCHRRHQHPVTSSQVARWGVKGWRA